MIKIYRNDIDGLRALAVVSVILFHLGFLDNGYLGVDVFFVISGYLITGIVYREVLENRFSILKFYERRIRRIIPLVLITTLVAFVLGVIFMLPDDLENLSQSVIASNFSANNILMYITSSDYWAVKNDFKPLMHTWSLGIEEQFYLLYPFIFLFLKGQRVKYILPLLIALSLFSLIAFIFKENVSAKFYFIQYRFFELSIGGIAAIYFNSSFFNKYNKSHFLLFSLLVMLISILFFPIIISNDAKIIIVTLITTGILVFGEIHFQKNRIYKNIFSNKLITGIGKISFSLYMWHQIVFAFARYIKFEEINLTRSIYLTSIIIVLSIISYHFIENPFRNRKLIKTKNVLIFLSGFFILITSASFYVYAVGGIIKDVPELGLEYEMFPDELNFFSSTNNIQIRYNENIRSYDKPFSEQNKVKVLVIGNSYGRDFSNIFFESNFIDSIEISYFDINRIMKDESIIERINKADFIFIIAKDLLTKDYIEKIELKYNINIDNRKLTIVGTKDFGYSNGIHYNNIRKNVFLDCNSYRTLMKNGIGAINEKMKDEWGSQFIDLIDLISDSNGKVLVFTPDCKFISQDTLHLTKSGASFFATLLDDKLRGILNIR